MDPVVLTVVAGMVGAILSYLSNKHIKSSCCRGSTLEIEPVSPSPVQSSPMAATAPKQLPFLEIEPPLQSPMADTAPKQVSFA